MGSRFEVDNIASSSYIQDDTDLTKRARFDVSGIASMTDRILTVPDATTTLVGTDVMQTLTNKTLTAPKIDQILDANGNELINFTTTASAVNEFTIANAATGTAPVISATGTNTNIDFSIQPKGTGKVILKGLTFPAGDGSVGQVIKTDGAGNLSFASVDLSSVFTVTTTNATLTTIATIATTNNTSIFVEANVLAIKSDFTKAVGYRFISLFRNAGGTVVKINEQKTILEESGVAAADSTTSASGANIIISVQGLTGQTYNWKVSYQITTV